VKRLDEARSRRVTRPIRVLLVLGSVTALAFLGVAWSVWSGALVDTAGGVSFDRRLKIPPLLEPEVDSTGRKVFSLDLREGAAELLPGTRTATWGVNGPYLGPTLRATRGDRVTMRVSTGLPEATTLHWHGMHLPPAADGGPHQMIEPDERWEPSWRIDQPAATLWYHPHLMGRTEEHVYRGVAGMFILDDPAATALELPATYGIDDIPLIVQDKRFEDDGDLSFSQGIVSPIGQLGDTVLVNGTSGPYLPVETSMVRLRLLNASTARIYNFGFSDGRAFELIATDGGLLAAPRELDRIQLSPGERAEIVVALDPGDDVVLRSFAPDLGGIDFFNRRFVGGDDSLDILQLRADDKLANSPSLPASLAASDELPDASESDRVRRFELSGSSSINGKEMDTARIDQVVPVGATELWEVENRGGIPHSFHVHDVRFRIVELAGDPPPPQLSGLKDTVLIPPGATARFTTHFSDYTDPKTPYMFHCHLLEHEDRGMMSQFVVVDPDRRARLPAAPHHE
jgi:FtsP/CotA-like multicopper oxidase with cupredoxin domain